MSVKPDRWIRRKALEHKMIEPFTDRQVREGVISYGVSSYGYDIRVADEFRIFTNVNSNDRRPEAFRSEIVRGVQGGRVHHPAKFVCAGAVSGILPDSAERADDLPRQIDVCAMRDHRERDAVRTGVGRLCDAGNQQHDTAAREDLRDEGLASVIFAGSGVVLLISSVTKPSHSGSNGVTFTMIPHRAYVDLPRQIVSTFRGIRKYSTDRASANEFGGMMHTSP